jgi:hypothetical protein
MGIFQSDMRESKRPKVGDQLACVRHGVSLLFRKQCRGKEGRHLVFRSRRLCK